MKAKLGMVLGAAVGIALYEAAANGLDRMDWVRVIAVPAIMFLIFAFLPGRLFATGRGATREGR